MASDAAKSPAPFSTELWRLSAPLAISMWSMGALSLVDTWMVGRLGTVSVGAVGLGGMAHLTVTSFGIAVFSAAKVQVGEAFGRSDTERIKSEFVAFQTLAWPLGFGLMILGLSLSPLLFVFGEGGVTEEAPSYLRLRLLSVPFVLSGHALAQWLSAQGRTRLVMQAAVVSGLCNAILNAIFLFVLRLGISGGAIATVIAQIVEWALLIALARPPLKELLRPRPKDALAVLSRGLSTGAERVLDMLAFLLVPLLLSAKSDADVASHQVALMFSQISFMTGVAISEGGCILISQAVGRKNEVEIRLLAQVTRRFCLYSGAIFGSAFVLGRGYLAQSFLEEPEAMRLLSATMLGAAATQAVNALYLAEKGALRGLSDFRFVAVTTVACAWIITPPLTYLGAVRLGLGAPFAWAVLCLEVTLGTLILRARFRKRFARWRQEVLLPDPRAPTSESSSAKAQS